MNIPYKAFFIFLLSTGIAWSQPDAEKLFTTNCVACHQLKNKKQPIVGPSLVEINHIYKDSPKAFIQWCVKPGKKRANMIQMPSMAHLGEDKLAAIHKWIKAATKGKKFYNQPQQKTDPYKLSKEEAAKPRIQRMFMPNTSPASMAVTLDGQHSLCWDTVSCRMRYAWHGGFIDAYPYWRSNGNTLAKVTGKIYYTSPKKLNSGIQLSNSKDIKPKFSGYSLKNGNPSFSYTLGKTHITEAYSKNKETIVIHFTVSGNTDPVTIPLGDTATANINNSAGIIENNILTLSADQAKSFTLTISPAN